MDTVTLLYSITTWTAYIFRDSFESQVQELYKQIKDKENELTLIDEQHTAVLKEKDAKITSLHENIEVLQNDLYLQNQQNVRTIQYSPLNFRRSAC
jgi:dynactin complex subunit